MKKTPLFLISNFISILLFSQSQVGYSVASISAMKNYSGQANRITVTATAQDFILCPACTSDESKVYAGVGGRKWKITSAAVRSLDSTQFFNPDTKQDKLTLTTAITSDGKATLSPVGILNIPPLGTSDTSRNVRYLSSAPVDGDIFVSSTDKRLWYKAGSYWYRVAITDSIPYGFIPQNLLRWSEQPENISAWDPTPGLTITTDNAQDPVGGNTADMVTLTADYLPLSQLVSVAPNTQYTFSFYAKRGTSTATNGLAVYDVSHSSSLVAGSNYYSQINSSTWTRLSITFTTPPGCNSIYVYTLQTFSERGTVYVWGAQLNAGALRGYTKTTGTAIP